VTLAAVATNDEPGIKHYTILIVEDEVLVRLMVADELRLAGFRVLEAMNADEALAILRASPHSVDLVMTDVRMPGSMDGVALAQLVRSTWPRLKIVVASGESVNWPCPHIADAFFGKPYDLEQVVQRIKSFLSDVPT
jgi:DNA-binding response OmpR family regulator